MKNKFLIVFALAGWYNVFSQNCNCFTNFNFVVSKMKVNYIGYNDKLQRHLPYKFASFTDSLFRKSKSAKNEYQCLTLINTWLQLFRDGHVAVTVNKDSATPADINRLFYTVEQAPVTEKIFLTYIKQKIPRSDSLTGIWEDQNKTYKVGVIQDPDKKNTFIGFILETKNAFWKKLQVKFRIKKQKDTYLLDYIYSMNHLKFFPSFSFNRQYLSFAEFGTWRKVDTGSINTTVNINKNYAEPTFQIIDKANCLFTIPSLNPVYKNRIDSLITNNSVVLKSTEHLIIDVRDNPGGSVLCFEKLIPFLYTEPIITKGSSVLASEDNVKYYSITDYPGVSDSMKTVFGEEANLLKAHMGQVYKLWPDDTLVLDKTFDYPKYVSILINNRCASSTELFILKAIQSKKVKLFGQHTLGAVDYTDAVSLNLPCRFFALSYSSSRTNRWPEIQIDNIGIQPDIIIPENTVDWPKFTIEYYKKYNPDKF